MLSSALRIVCLVRSFVRLAQSSVEERGLGFSVSRCCPLEIKSRIRAAWDDPPQTQTRIDIKKNMLKLRLRLFDATVSRLLLRSRTWTPSKEHERMIQSTQRKMLRLIIQTKRKYKKIEKQVIESKDEEGIADKTENCSTNDETGGGQSTKSEDDYGQWSDI